MDVMLVTREFCDASASLATIKTDEIEIIIKNMINCKVNAEFFKFIFTGTNKNKYLLSDYIIPLVEGMPFSGFITNKAFDTATATDLKIASTV